MHRVSIFTVKPFSTQRFQMANMFIPEVEWKIRIGK